MRSRQRPHAPAWSQLKQYSTSAARRLILAYAASHRGGECTLSPRTAYTHVAPWYDLQLPDEQRPRVLYVLSMAYTAERDFGPALNGLGEAMGLASRLSDDPALAELPYLRGSIYRAVGFFEPASDALHTSLALTREQAENGPSPDPSFEISLLARAAGFDYMLGRFEPADEQLREADIYANIGSPISASRIQTLVGEIALDQAISFTANLGSDATSAYLDLAEPYSKRGLSLARTAQDPLGGGLASLAAARRSWLARANTDRPDQLLGLYASPSVAATARRLRKHTARSDMRARGVATVPGHSTGIAEHSPHPTARTCRYTRSPHGARYIACMRCIHRNGR
ncbi:MAG TPA: hypothetical protein VGP82_03115 [Ktedonobacterales bacterium]|nr:hypothetical protein [Ktedonobacterales bacterium]